MNELLSSMKHEMCNTGDITNAAASQHVNKYNESIESKPTATEQRERETKIRKCLNSMLAKFSFKKSTGDMNVSNESHNEYPSKAKCGNFLYQT